mgnify:CR=1 FL=1
MRPTYSVIVGNIGTVYSGTNLRNARFHAREYVDQSKRGYGRASGESVTVMQDDEILDEYIGSLAATEHDEDEDEAGA